MPSPFENALIGLAAADQVVVRQAFFNWAPDADSQQAKENIEQETALAPSDFIGLLSVFHRSLSAGSSVKDAWRDACRSHQFKGNILPSPHCPVLLGRVKNLEDHADDISVASRKGGARGGLTKEEARKFLLKHAGGTGLGIFEARLRNAVLGRYVVWATFHEADSSLPPFDQLPTTHQGVCTALGLGHVTPADRLILLTWSHADSGSPPLHRPTVADAGEYAYYHPHPDAARLWGQTEPLPPNAGGLSGQPELVLHPLTGHGLRLPFLIYHV